MASISSLMGITRIAMSAYQTAIDTTARNIANVDNEAYSRRRASISQLVTPSSRNSGSGLGQEGIERIREHFVQNQLWYKKQNLGKNETDELIFSQIEKTFGEPSESGLTNILTQFWNSWNDLANDPESSTARTIVKDRAILLSNTFKQIASDLHNLQEEIGYDIQDRVDTINGLLSQIREINTYSGPNMTYDLLDQRDKAIDDLSQLININVSEDSEGMVRITTGGNMLVPLVSGDFINPIETRVARFSELYQVDVSFAQGGQVEAITGGELGSLLSIHNDYLPSYLNDLDTMAVELSQAVNAVHQTGYNLDNATGKNFFSPNVGNALTFELDASIYADPTLIASSAYAGEAGDGTIAQQISDLQFANTVEAQKIGDYYNSLISNVGDRVQEAKFLKSNHEMVIQSLENQRDSVSAVSLDEEMTNLVRYEQAYEAASRMIKVVDDLMQTVINLI